MKINSHKGTETQSYLIVDGNRAQARNYGAARTFFLAAGDAVNTAHMISIEQNGNDIISLLSGLPNRMLTVEATSSLDEPITWTPLGTMTFSAVGYGEFTETNAPPVRYYRLKKEGE